MQYVTNSANDRLHAICEREWTWRREQFAGYDDEDSQGQPADHLPHVDVTTQIRRAAYWSDVLQTLGYIPEHELDDDAAIDLAVHRTQVEALLDGQRFRTWEMPLNGDSAFWSDLGFTARRPHHSLAELEQYLGQLRDIPRYFNEQIDNMRAGLARGFSVPRVTLDGRAASLTPFFQSHGAEDNLFFTPLRNLPGPLEAGDGDRLRAEACRIIQHDVMPAYAHLHDFLRDVYVPQARPTLAAADLPNGEAYYRAQIRRFTTLDMRPADIHAIGLNEVELLHDEMEQTIARTGFKGGFRAFLDYLRHEPRFYATSAEQLLKQAAWIAKRVDACVGDFIGRLPRQRFAISPVPDELAESYTSGRGGPGMYLLNTSHLSSRPLYALTALTLHEASPGHALQMSLAAEMEGLPDFRRLVHLSAYTEGWALYCEKLGVEMGLYETPYDHFGYLAYQAWRACRLVVDTGIHHYGWSREKARNYLRDNTALSEIEVCSEVDRYIAWPGQALSYYLGMLCITQARARAEQALGARFDLRHFHDAILAQGSVPLPVLERSVDRFIAQHAHRHD
ncbi:MAG TPA: DUF885 family protein [Rhodanobacteraceae bacterium]